MTRSPEARPCISLRQPLPSRPATRGCIARRRGAGRFGLLRRDGWTRQ